MINNFEISIGADFSPFSKSKHNLALAKIKENHKYLFSQLSLNQ